jgi:hypothetical protein
MKEKPVKPDENVPTKRRFSLALVILIWGILGITALGIVAIVYSARYSNEEDVFTAVKDILAILIPVISAWVGTVLAFYFSKENFESASNQSRELYKQFTSSKEKLQSIIAGDVMIKIEDADKLVLTKEEKDILLKADIVDGVLEKNKDKKRNRLPVLTKDLKGKYMIHRSMIDKFFVEQVEAGKKIVDLKLQDMLNVPEYKEMISNSFGFIKDSASLLDAKSYIDRVEICLDVFVTKSGKSDSPVIGWITNAIVTEKSSI